MSNPNLVLLHIGPVRFESQKIIQRYKGVKCIVHNRRNAAFDRFNFIDKDLIKRSTVINKYLSLEPGEKTIFCYNVLGFDSLSPEKNLSNIYPGVKLVKEEKVETIDLFKALDELGTSEINDLILENPENALEMLDKWERDKLLDKIHTLHIRTSNEPLYQGMPVYNEILKWCSEHGFETIKHDLTDKHFSLVSFKRNQLYFSWVNEKIKCEAIKDELKEVEIKLYKEIELSNSLKKELYEKNKNLEAKELKILKHEVLEEEAEGLRRDISNLENTIRHCFAQNRLQLEQAANALGEHISQCKNDIMKKEFHSKK